MTIDVKVLALANLIVQSLLMIVLSVAAYSSLITHNYKKHCHILRFAVPMELLAIAFVMAPSLFGYLTNEHKGVLFNTEILLHHTLGLVVVGAWTYANLVLSKTIKPRIRLRIVMRTAFVSWIITYLMGVYLYFSIYGF